MYSTYLIQFVIVGKLFCPKTYFVFKNMVKNHPKIEVIILRLILKGLMPQQRKGCCKFKYSTECYFLEKKHRIFIYS